MSRITTPLIVAFAAAALLAPSQDARAWKHIDPSPYVWTQEDFPLPYYVDQVCEESVPEEYCLQVIGEAYDSWKAVPCVEYDFRFADFYDNGPYCELGPDHIGCTAGECADPRQGACPGQVGFNNTNNRNEFSFNDPADELDEGTVAATLTFRFGNAFTLDGTIYAHAIDSDIMFNDGFDFGTHEEIVGGQCNGQNNMRSTMVHEIGHSLGLGHSCDQFEPCTDQDLLGAVMYYTSRGGCETLVEPAPDDVQGITPLYGPSARFSCSHEINEDQAKGVVPLDLNCVVESEGFLNEVTEATWSFGDGNADEGMNVTNTYTEPGNYTIEVAVHGERDECGVDGWNSTFRKVGFVTVCDVPEPVFTSDHYDGLQYQMTNRTDVSVFGCISDIQWEVYKGSKASGTPIDVKKAWEPLFEFPEEGQYTVIVNIGGIGGTGASSITIDAKDRRGQRRGCDSVGSAGVFGSASFLVVGFGLLGLRRRQD